MRKLRIIFGYSILVLIAFSKLYPFFAMVSLSLADNSEIFSNVGKIFPTNLTLDNYRNVFKDIPLSIYFFNSLVVALIATIGQVIFSSLAGYAFARMRFKYRDALFLIILITMLIPPQVNIIPLFFLMREMHLIDTYQALILPALFGGFGIFLMRQYFLGLPKDLEESAKIDGCNLFTTFFKIACTSNCCHTCDFYICHYMEQLYVAVNCYKQRGDANPTCRTGNLQGKL